jgi:hypothetical protein
MIATNNLGACDGRCVNPSSAPPRLLLGHPRLEDGKVESDPACPRKEWSEKPAQVTAG